MAQGINRFFTKMTIHPLFFPLLFGMVLYGNVSYYVLILTSLIIHEFGHMIAAILMKEKVERCVIMPYGGEIELQGGYRIHPLKQLIIALGGPVATLLCFVISPLLDPLLAEPFIKIQIILLVINMVPIWPLDGGRVVLALIVLLHRRTWGYEMFLSLSFIIILGLMIITFIMLPDSLFLFILSVFLFIKIVQEWRYRKYRVAFEKHALKRLT